MLERWSCGRAIQRVAQGDFVRGDLPNHVEDFVDMAYPGRGFVSARRGAGILGCSRIIDAGAEESAEPTF